MTEHHKLKEIAVFVRYQGLHLRICQQSQRKAGVNGWYQNNTICIYTRDRCAEASEIAALILHEYGHYLIEQNQHTRRLSDELQIERLAWQLGRKSVPACWRPSAFTSLRRRCLKSYYQR
jgi:hypothetical protein